MAGSRPDSGREHGSARASSAQPHPDQSQRWVGHPVAAMLVRLAVVLVPPGTAVAAAAAVSRRLPSPHGLAADVLWWSVLLALSTAVLVAADRVLRRVLPLAALLQMSVLFPGRAPSRFAVARQAGSTRRLGELVRRAELAALRSEPVLAAERILALVAALDGHDRRTHGHAERVRVFTDLIAEEMRLPQADRDRLRWASLLHDIGKISVPSALLNKAGKPSVTEWDLLRRHPDEGARLAAPLLPWLGEWGSVIDQHHERYDGLGYPRGLAGTAICPGARIVAVADSFEVMTAPRAYKRAMNRAAALQELARCAGSQFDPAAVRALLQVSTPRLRWAMGPLSWLAQVPLVSPASSSAVAGQAVVGIGALAIGGAVGLGASGAQAGDAGPQGWPADAAQSAAAVPVGAGSAYDQSARPTAVTDRSGAGLAAADGSSAGRPAGVSPGEAAEAKTYPDEADPSGQGGRHGAGQRVLTRLVAPVAPREAAAAGGLPQVRGAAKPVVAGVLAGVADESLPVVAPATDLAHRLP